MIIYNSENIIMHAYSMSIYVSLYMYKWEKHCNQRLRSKMTATSNKEGKACYVKVKKQNPNFKKFKKFI